VAPRWTEIVDAGGAFHAALAGFPQPSFRRADVWAVGDRAARHEPDVDVVPELRTVHAALTPLVPRTADGRAQLVHDDLTGNVLFAPGRRASASGGRGRPRPPPRSPVRAGRGARQLGGVRPRRARSGAISGSRPRKAR